MSATGAAQKALTEGMSICNPKLHGLIVDWVRKNSKFSDFRDLHLILFDSHTPTMAMNFLKQKAPSIFLVESSQLKATAQKDFVSNFSQLGSHEFLKKYDTDGLLNNLKLNPKSTRLEAFHANMRSLLIPSKAKPLNEPFFKRLFNMKSEVFDKSVQVSTVLVGCVPSSANQTSLLQSLFRQWVLALHDEEIEKSAVFEKSYGLQSIYKFEKFPIVTLLRTSVFAKLISTKNASDLNFFVNQHLFFSFMFNILFDVKVLQNRDAFSLDYFQPEISSEKDISFEDKIVNAGFERDALYAVQLSPRDEGELFDLFQLKGIDLRKDIVALLFWMELASKLRKTKVCNDELSVLFADEPYEPLFESERLVSSIGPEEFLHTFPRIRDALVVNQAIYKKFKVYRDQMLGYRREDYVD